ncbi:PiggyBac transposable element-derived protein 4-like [Plakobranchus ocellatus]|uniref:PiggyBac transposable element-derived protein 4-like n=1 Tax=Plakobranchus ocellatus TaxID=259542 RepID=A0AAV4AIV6_9GAST|nr:PiggyBac transposable element-derived protein 4-like [Plakobranchus ocellatus]
MPRDLMDQRVAKGELDYRHNGQIIITKWMDKREAITLSTMSKPSLRVTQGRFELKTNLFLSLITQVTSKEWISQTYFYPTVNCKSVKWWKKPFFHLLTLPLIQSHILSNKYRKITGKRIQPLDTFVKAVINGWVDVCAPECTAIGPLTALDRLNDKHLVTCVPSPPEKTTTSYRNCKVCYDKALKAAKALKNSKQNASRLSSGAISAQ